jgi:hypothetical protein
LPCLCGYSSPAPARQRATRRIGRMRVTPRTSRNLSSGSVQITQLTRDIYSRLPRSLRSELC